MPGLNGKGPAGNKPGRKMGRCANAQTADTELIDNKNCNNQPGRGRGMRNGRGKGFWRSEPNKSAEATE
jgi:hypothetical protein